MAHRVGEAEEQNSPAADGSTQHSSLISGKISQTSSPTDSYNAKRMNQKIYHPALPNLPSKTRRRHKLNPRRPLSIDYRILLLFAATAAILLAALQVIGYLSDHWSGFTTALPHEYYLWTFGPTAGKFRRISVSSCSC